MGNPIKEVESDMEDMVQVEVGLVVDMMDQVLDRLRIQRYIIPMQLVMDRAVVEECHTVAVRALVTVVFQLRWVLNLWVEVINLQAV